MREKYSQLLKNMKYSLSRMYCRCSNVYFSFFFVFCFARLITLEQSFYGCFSRVRVFRHKLKENIRAFGYLFLLEMCTYYGFIAAIKRTWMMCVNYCKFDKKSFKENQKFHFFFSFLRLAEVSKFLGFHSSRLYNFSSYLE